MNKWKEEDLFKYLSGCCYTDLVKSKKQCQDGTVIAPILFTV